MIDNHRAVRRFVAVVLGLWGIGLMDAAGAGPGPRPILVG